MRLLRQWNMGCLQTGAEHRMDLYPSAQRDAGCVTRQYNAAPMAIGLAGTNPASVRDDAVSELLKQRHYECGRRKGKR